MAASWRALVREFKRVLKNVRTFHAQKLHRKRKTLEEGSRQACKVDREMARVKECKLSEEGAERALLYALGRKRALRGRRLLAGEGDAATRRVLRTLCAHKKVQDFLQDKGEELHVQAPPDPEVCGEEHPSWLAASSRNPPAWRAAGAPDSPS